MKKVIFLTCLSGNVFYKKGDEALLNLSEALRLKEKGVVDFVSNDDEEVQEQDQTNEEAQEVQESETNEEENEEKEQEISQNNPEKLKNTKKGKK
ncbi:hypothetical protein [Campylobacter aviculae]|uniref:Uncharacterized protein n=1 Tax=Campylobacter aviculae TaxID=2510190 RepID=A0A4U7BKB7_9BACT|nr:hypothetical protein [Campylobacter aviculae]TKX32383.1 hypothetical protein CQA76_03410 [Campylobacter aviculae]